MKRAIQTIFAVTLVAGLGSIAVAVNIETVPVGNPGNAVDDTGYGAVNYAYNIGKYEVTAGQYTEFLNAVAARDPYGLYNSNMDSNSRGCQITQHGTSGAYTYDFSGRPSGTEANWSNRPVNYVSWYDALRFSNWLTNGQESGDTETGSYTITGSGPTWTVDIPNASQRGDWATAGEFHVMLTSENEWYKAAYYDLGLNAGAGGYYDYPTSNESVPSYAPNLRGNNATFYDQGYTIGGPYYRTEVGEHENSDSPYGTFDQGGNVWEWNEAIVAGSYRGLRGGSFTCYDRGLGRSYLRASYRYYGIRPSSEYYGFGFRVSQVPEPATLSLLTLGGLAMLRWRRRGACR
ncbi:MAG: SUMF1/EgtB/PvdO family nonheme iron enzyme [Phycisphaerae bacterium]|jgi:formylglycine-generating enzyme required for sulfatase activity|nr:SUMF1/EgtB/PvdO family nonheme iron enzyme [Phycisphaerae bacterium]